MKRVADRVAGQFFNALDALMQRVAMEPSRSAAAPRCRSPAAAFEGLQQQPRRFTARLDQAAEGVVHKIVEQRRVLTADSSLINPAADSR